MVTECDIIVLDFISKCCQNTFFVEPVPIRSIFINFLPAEMKPLKTKLYDTYFEVLVVFIFFMGKY